MLIVPTVILTLQLSQQCQHIVHRAVQLSALQTPIILTTQCLAVMPGCTRLLTPCKISLKILKKKFKLRIRLLDASRKLKITRNVDYYILQAY